MYILQQLLLIKSKICLVVQLWNVTTCSFTVGTSISENALHQHCPQSQWQYILVSGHLDDNTTRGITKYHSCQTAQTIVNTTSQYVSCEIRYIKDEAKIYSHLQNKLPSFRILCYIGCKPNCRGALAWCVLATRNQVVYIRQQLWFTGTRVTTQKDVDLCPEYTAEHVL